MRRPCLVDWLLDYYNYRVVADYLSVFARGAYTTLWLSLLCLALSLVLGTGVAIARMSSVNLIWRAAAAYIQFVRATPLLIQIYLVYYGVPALTPLGNALDETQTGIVALTLHTAPYMGEIIRAGLESVERGQIEAAMAVGMNRWERFIHVVLPQALANVTPPLLGQTAVLIKDTSLLSIIAVFELMSAGLTLFSERVMPTEAYVSTAVCYLLIYGLMLIVSTVAQNRLGGAAWQTRQ